MRAVTMRSRRCSRWNVGYLRRNLGTLEESWMLPSKEQIMRTVPRRRRMQNTSPMVQSVEKIMGTVPGRDVFDIRSHEVLRSQCNQFVRQDLILTIETPSWQMPSLKQQRGKGPSVIHLILTKGSSVAYANHIMPFAKMSRKSWFTQMFRGTAPDVRRWALCGTCERVQMKGTSASHSWASRGQ